MWGDNRGNNSVTSLSGTERADSKGGQEPGFDYVSASVAVDIPFAPLTSADHGGFGLRYRAAEYTHDWLHSHDNSNVVTYANYVREGVICCWVTAAVTILILDILELAPLASDEDEGGGAVVLLILTVFFAVCTLLCFLLHGEFRLSDSEPEPRNSEMHSDLDVHAGSR